MSSQALTKREAEQSLMPPPPPPKRIKRPASVLDEDIYTNALSEIIARDFFPGLLETQIKQEYLEALESKDKAWIASSKRKLAEMTSGRTDGRRRAAGNRTPQSPTATPRPGPGDTPTGWGGETPMSVVSTESASTVEQSEEGRERIPDISNLGLLSFQGKYTSEDNESFNKLLDNQNAKRRDRYRWIWSGNKIPSARQIAHERRETKRITARGEKPDYYEDGEQQDGDENNREGQQIKEQGGEGEGREKAIKTDLNARPAKPDAWAARPENQLMFLPASIEDTHETVQQRAENQSRAAPKRVLYQNTRLHEPPPDNAPPPSPSISAIQNAIAGRPYPSASEAGSQAGGETPKVNGYAFVDEDEPDLVSNPPPVDEDDDLRLLGKGSSTPNPFQIAQTRKREDLHHRMVDGVARKKRVEKAARETKTPVVGTPRFASSPRLDFGLRTPAGAGATPGGGGSGTGPKALTPAAQKLLQRVGSTPTPRSNRKEEGSGLRNMWTPTPRRK